MPIPKVMEALWIVRQFPRQIRRDLHRFHGVKLADWWRGTRGPDGELLLPSDELVDYLTWMDEDGAFKTASERGGRWTDLKTMLARVANNINWLHSDWLGSKVGEKGMYYDREFGFMDPVDRKRLAEQAEADARAAATSTQRFEADIGFLA